MVSPSFFKNSFIEGILEGYQTFDAIGGILVGGVIVISLALQTNYSYHEKKSIISKAGWIAGFGLMIIYGGLIALGAHFNSVLVAENRTDLLGQLSIQTLGNIGSTFLSILFALACFTTAVGIITGTVDFVKGITNNSKLGYTLTAIFACFVGILVGQFNVGYIINIAIPALMFIYPITIILILLNVLPEKYTSKIVFRTVVLVTFIFSIPDFLQFFVSEDSLSAIKSVIPLSENSMGWVLPLFVTFICVNGYSRLIQNNA